MPSPTAVILGASADRRKFGNKAVRAHVHAGYQVYPINPNEKTVEGLPAYASVADVPPGPVERVSIYLPPAVTLNLLDDIAKLNANEIWLNPGAESPELLAHAQAINLPVIQGCSIVDLGTSPAQFPD